MRALIALSLALAVIACDRPPQPNGDNVTLVCADEGNCQSYYDDGTAK